MWGAGGQSLVRFVGTAKFGTMQGGMYQLIGGELSPYTAKARSYLIYKSIPHERVAATAEIYAGFIKKEVGWSVIPVLVTPEKEVIQDTSNIIDYLEERHPRPSILPTGPKQRVAAKLLELLGDEWLVQPIMHYRWSFPENLPFLKQEFGRMVMPKASHEDQRQMAEMVYEKFKGMTKVLGITEATGPEIEKSWKGLLGELSSHFDKHPYFLGGRPCIGDFAFGGMLYAHLFRDPVPGYLMKTTAPAVSTWCEMMNGSLPEANRNNLHVLEDGFPVKERLSPQATDFCADDEIPDTLAPILRRMLEEFAPVLLSTKKHLSHFIQENITKENTLLPRLIGNHEYTIGGVSGMRSIIPFNVWMWQRVVDEYQSLSKKEKLEVDKWTSSLPYGSDIVTADLTTCRVKRIKNFLHADLSSQHKSKL